MGYPSVKKRVGSWKMMEKPRKKMIYSVREIKKF